MAATMHILLVDDDPAEDVILRALMRKVTTFSIDLHYVETVDAALDFLNTEDAVLSGRPIAVATQSEAGYASVEREIRARSVLPGARHGE